MSKNVFADESVKKADIKRNSFDLSHFNNMTMNMGKFYPNLVIESLPNDSFKIKASAGFNAMPMVYPVQTPIYFNQYFFKCRNRAVHKNWKKFITGGPGADRIVPPYLALHQGSEQAVKVLTTGSLGDYMGIPTINESSRVVVPWIGLSPVLGRILSNITFADGSPVSFLGGFIDAMLLRTTYGYDGDGFWQIPAFNTGNGVRSEPLSVDGYNQYLRFQLASELNWTGVVANLETYTDTLLNNFGAIYALATTPEYFRILETPELPSANLVQFLSNGSTLSTWDGFTEVVPMNFATMKYWQQGDADDAFKVGDFLWKVDRTNDTFTDEVYATFCDELAQLFENFRCYVSFVGINSGNVYADALCRVSAGVMSLTPLPADSNAVSIQVSLFAGSNREFRYFDTSLNSDEPIIGVFSFAGGDSVSESRALMNQMRQMFNTNRFYSLNLFHADVEHVVSSVLASSPFTTSSYGEPPAIPISALPFRHYESIFNSYFRRQQVDPLMINGEPEYQDFVRSKEDGADDLIYDFFNRYWEADFLTSCMPSPQQGSAPLVGVTSAGTFTFEDSNGVQYTAQAVVGDDGQTMSGIDVMSADIPSGSLKELMNYVNHGMSINDFRNANCLQLYLESNLRSGYRYRDMMKSQHGVVIRFDELDMPEYIGGFSVPVQMNKVINSDAQGDVPLGQFAGLGEVMGKSSYSSHCFCDEHGFIIGICSITPVPVYSQNLPKFFTKSKFLDYYERHFAKIGYQPVTYREVTPVNRYNESLEDGSEVSIDDVFGYQRAWYEYMSMQDEAHGEFRSSLRDYIMYRLFGQSPELGKDFITVDKDQVNNVFASNDSSDKFVGQVYFDITARREVLRNVTPGII